MNILLHLVLLRQPARRDHAWDPPPNYFGLWFLLTPEDPQGTSCHLLQTMIVPFDQAGSTIRKS
jgi:hypothetical protein